MDPVLLSQIFSMVKWGVEAIDADRKGEKSEEEIMSEFGDMQGDFKDAVSRWQQKD